MPAIASAQQPPIIDRQAFFGEIQIAGAQISPDGQYISFLKPYKGTRNIWVKKAGEPFTAARPLSAEATRPVRGYFWSRDSKYLLYAQDAGGDASPAESRHIYWTPPCSQRRSHRPFLIVTEAPDDAWAARRQTARLALRRRLLAEREIFAASNAAPLSGAALAKAFCAVIADLQPGCLGLYHALRSEFNAAGALAVDARFNDLPLALPFARRTPRAMDFRRWNGDTPSLVDECGIAASAGAVVVPDVVVVPCVGFTEDGHRLGYGGGYFDRWLAEHPEATSVGIAWSFTEIAATVFAAQPHDIALSLIVTERGPR